MEKLNNIDFSSSFCFLSYGSRLSFELWKLSWKHMKHYPRQSYNENEEGRRFQMAHLCSDSKCVGCRWGGGYLWLPHWERSAHSHEREQIWGLNVAYGRVGGWVQKKSLAFLTFTQLQLYQSDPGLFPLVQSWVLRDAILIIPGRGILLPPRYLHQLPYPRSTSISSQPEYVLYGCHASYLCDESSETSPLTPPRSSLSLCSSSHLKLSSISDFSSCKGDCLLANVFYSLPWPDSQDQRVSSWYPTSSLVSNLQGIKYKWQIFHKTWVEKLIQNILFD